MKVTKVLVVVLAATACLAAAGPARPAIDEDGSEQDDSPSIALAPWPSDIGSEEISICFDYGCASRATVEYSPAELGQVWSQFVDAESPLAEREAIARAMAWLYFYAGLQSPIWRDRGGNFDDDDTRPGRMDCIDHSTNTTVFLALMERRGWLKFHTVGEPVRRLQILEIHWSARIVERATKQEWVVDTWFLDPGQPATIYSLKAWLGGAEPRGAAIVRIPQ